MLRSSALCLALIALLVGCPSEEEEEEHICGDLTRVMTYVAGLDGDSTAGALTMSILEAAPAPPDVGDNTWTVDVIDAAGAPAAGCTAAVTSYMPDHGHASAAAPTWTEDVAVIGQYFVDEIDLFMPGYWTVTFEVDCGGTTDTVVYGFCAEG